MIFRRSKPKTERPLRREDYEKLGKEIVSFYDAVGPTRRSVLQLAFLKGLATGVGTVLGATVIVAILLWALSLFDELPFVGGFFESLQNTIEQQ